MMNQYHALVVDDEADIRELLQLTLEKMDISCHCAENVEQAHNLLRKHKFNLCLTDMKLPDGTGLDLVQHVQENHSNLPIAVITAYGSMQTAIDALKLGAFDFISKPVQLDVLRNLISSALKLGADPEASGTQQDVLQGESEPMIKIRDMIRKLARTQAPVHIQGESGTGKELAARQIHNLSSRRDKPFIAINCGAIPGDLMESEFFGHKKGSFTGADRDKIGLFQASDGGTLFLDEVAELPPVMQVKLLRAIQERAIRPVGSSKELPVDIRILSATNKNLKALVDNNEFRDDLYFRLNVIELHLPPLRDRGSDITLLSRSILNSLKGNLQLSEPAIKALQHYPFPGNIRELKNILERAEALCESNTIMEDDLCLPEHAEETDMTPVDMPAAHALRRRNEPLEEYLENIERDEIETALNKCHWNRTEAARMLGMSARQLRYRMNKLNLAEK